MSINPKKKIDHRYLISITIIRDVILGGGQVLISHILQYTWRIHFINSRSVYLSET